MLQLHYNNLYYDDCSSTAFWSVYLQQITTVKRENSKQSKTKKQLTATTIWTKRSEIDVQIDSAKAAVCLRRRNSIHKQSAKSTTRCTLLFIGFPTNNKHCITHGKQ
ncbi:hypothetical protein Tsp_06323 [Trichinella spiralis]|uniref:hypothetical protein n=1 Tax=Trichinella spiralis TaxID=6334 RepID=UPI0001EFBEC8|nr:hypothetical protein Tsp_06323 [Trichinella spiralis]